MAVPYWLQQVIYPMIKDTTCYYCIFIRGTLLGALLGVAVTGVILWAVYTT